MRANVPWCSLSHLTPSFHSMYALMPQGSLRCIFRYLGSCFHWNTSPLTSDSRWVWNSGSNRMNFFALMCEWLMWMIMDLFFFCFLFFLSCRQTVIQHVSIKRLCPRKSALLDATCLIQNERGTFRLPEFGRHQLVHRCETSGTENVLIKYKISFFSKLWVWQFCFYLWILGIFFLWISFFFLTCSFTKN